MYPIQRKGFLSCIKHREKSIHPNSREILWLAWSLWDKGQEERTSARLHPTILGYAPQNPEDFPRRGHLCLHQGLALPRSAEEQAVT